MNAIRELYQEVIIDHGRNPRNWGELPPPCATKQGFNPLCGDKITLYLRIKAQTIEAIRFNGCGCAISMASASLMSQAIMGQSIAEVEHLFTAFHASVTENNNSYLDVLGKSCGINRCA